MSEELKKKLEGRLREAKNRILTDVEDRYVYSNERPFLPEEEKRMPDIVIKVKSFEEAEIARETLLEEGYISIYRDRVLWPIPAEGKIGLIDATEPILPLVYEEPANFTEFSNLRIDGYGPNVNLVRKKCEGHTICKGYCPICQTVYGDIETWSSKGRLLISRGITTEEIEPSEKVANTLFSCATCGNCFKPCTVDTERIFEGFLRAKRKIIEEKPKFVPVNIGRALESTYTQGNPFGEVRTKRIKWTEDSDVWVKILKEGDSADVLLFVGCSPSYDTRNQEIVRSLCKILNHLDLGVGILGNEENCCGIFPRVSGEEGLFEELVERNSKFLGSVDYDNFVTICPHCYHTFKNYYPKYGIEVNPMHYTQFLEKHLKPKKVPGLKEEKVAIYHDSCYLDRHNGVHDEPRELLKGIEGIKLIEMDIRALCCGGGGSRMWFEDPFVESKPPEPIIKRALNRGASVLAVACPFCVTNFEDSVKTMEVEDRLIVKDISELIALAL